MDDKRKKPVETLRDGSIKAAIWENDGEKGKFNSVTFSRTYRDQNGEYGNSNRFSGTDILKLSKLAEQSYDAIQQRRAQGREQKTDYAKQQREATKRTPNNDRKVDR